MSARALKITPRRIDILREVQNGKVMVVLHGDRIGDARDHDLRTVTAEANRLADAGLIVDGGPKRWFMGPVVGWREDDHWRTVVLTDAGRAVIEASGGLSS